MCNIFDVDFLRCAFHRISLRSIRCYASERSSTFFALCIKKIPSKTEKKRSPRMQFWGWKDAHNFNVEDIAHHTSNT